MKTSVLGCSRDELVEKAYQLGYKYEQQTSFCSQATLAALQDVFQIRDDNVFKASYGFHGGSGDRGIGMCGALAGGIITISWFFGRTRSEFNLPVAHTTATRLVGELVDLFQKEWGGISCNDVQKKLFGRALDTRKKENHDFFIAMHGIQEKCPRAVSKGAALATGIIWDELHSQEGADELI